MKTKWVATSNARTFIKIYQNKINWGLIFFISALLFFSSCSKSDDLEKIATYSPIVDNPPINNPTYNPIYNPTNNPIDTGSNIIYTDIEPDFDSSNNGVYNLDLDNDGIVDFTFKNLQENWAFWAEPNLNTNSINAFVAVSGPFQSYIVPIGKDDVISSMLNSPYFYDGYDCLLIMEFCNTIPPYCSYGWQGKVDYYVGLRIMINEQTHYAWVRLDVTHSNRWIVKDYAYNAAPDKPIFAGQKE